MSNGTEAVAAGPVSAVLEADLRTWVQKHGIVMWLDLANHYSAFVDRLAVARQDSELPYDVRAFRGSHLELMLALEGVAAASVRPLLVVHLPGFNEDSVGSTPLLELYAAGSRYRKALDTLVTDAAAGRVPPADIADFLSHGSVTLEDADAWLDGRLSGGERGIAGWLRETDAIGLMEALLSGHPRLRGHEASTTVRQRLAALTGLPSTWVQTVVPGGPRTPADVAHAMASWALAVEYGNDLKREPVNDLLSGVRQLPRGVIETCRQLADQLRLRHESVYRRVADETETLLDDERVVATAEDLGLIDTFRFEEDKVLDAALNALQEHAWEAASTWADQRMHADGKPASFWLRHDPFRLQAWQLVGDAARLGRAVDRAGGLGATSSLDAVLAAYVDRGAAVDLAHRHLEQRRAVPLSPSMPQFERLRAQLDEVRRVWRRWADEWARDFNAVCRANGFLPRVSLQQRALFDEVVRPLAQQSGTTALFVIDAFRFEMATELQTLLTEIAGATARLDARYAELPTVTEVGMNVLAPVWQNGRLSPALSTGNGERLLGFSTGEYRVTDPDSRKRAMHERVGGTSCPWMNLDELLQRDVASLRRSTSRASLMVVHSREIDKAGEEGLGPVVFDRVMQQLRAAWQLLREAGIRRFVFTSDHGFLLLDETTATAQTHGRRIDPKRRHVLSPVAADHRGEVRVPLADLGYSGATAHLMMPETTAVFDTGRGGCTFVHGGNSLQERVIPVLTLVHRGPAGGTTQEYKVSARPLDGVADMHCLELVVEAEQVGLDFGAPPDVELSLRVDATAGIEVELCQTRRGGRISGGVVLAPVGQSFEVFFRLIGAEEQRVRVQVRHASGVVDVTERLFDVIAVPNAAAQTGATPGDGWLQSYTDPGERQVFQHLFAHGAITETEAASMLGGPRALRRFANRFDELVQKAPFSVRVDTRGVEKRYVREGNSR